jgi:hypothetical protein
MDYGGFFFFVQDTRGMAESWTENVHITDGRSMEQISLSGILDVPGLK